MTYWWRARSKHKILLQKCNAPRTLTGYGTGLDTYCDSHIHHCNVIMQIRSTRRGCTLYVVYKLSDNISFYNPKQIAFSQFIRSFSLSRSLLRLWISSRTITLTHICVWGMWRDSRQYWYEFLCTCIVQCHWHSFGKGLCFSIHNNSLRNTNTHSHPHTHTTLNESYVLTYGIGYVVQ